MYVSCQQMYVSCQQMYVSYQQMYVSCQQIPADGFIVVLRHRRLFFIETNRLKMSGLRNSNVQPAARFIYITKTLHHNYH